MSKQKYLDEEVRLATSPLARRLDCNQVTISDIRGACMLITFSRASLTKGGIPTQLMDMVMYRNTFDELSPYFEGFTPAHLSHYMERGDIATANHDPMYSFYSDDDVMKAYRTSTGIDGLTFVDDLQKLLFKSATVRWKEVIFANVPIVLFKGLAIVNVNGRQYKHLMSKLSYSEISSFIGFGPTDKVITLQTAISTVVENITYEKEAILEYVELWGTVIKRLLVDRYGHGHSAELHKRSESGRLELLVIDRHDNVVFSIETTERYLAALYMNITMPNKDTLAEYLDAAECSEFKVNDSTKN